MSCIYCQAIGGNIMTASPISDLNPVFMAMDSKLTLISKGKIKTFFTLVFVVQRSKIDGISAHPDKC